MSSSAPAEEPAPQRRTRTAIRVAAVAALTLLFLGLLFWLPYRVPSSPVISDSYLFGYNNRAAQWIVAIWLLALAAFGPSLPRARAPGRPLGRADLRWALLVTGCLATVMYLSTRELNGISESVYFTDRLRLLLAGQRPFRDFEFVYGAGLLYVPAALALLLHLPATDACDIFWIGVSLLGVWLLYRTVQSVEELPGAQRPLFLLFWCAGLTFLLCFGVNYSLLRFVLPCYLAAVVHRRLFRRHANTATALLLPLPFYLLLLLVSPELAIAFAVGMAVYLLCFGRLGQPRNLLAFAVALLGEAAISFIAFHLGIFSTLEAFRAGGYNFPLMPAPHLLLLFLLLVLCALYAGHALRLRRRRHPPSVLLAFVAVSAIALASALGRCDQVHALMNPFGLVLAGMFLLWGFGWLRWGVLAGAWLLMFVLLLPAFFLPVPMEIAKSALPTIFAREFARQATHTDVDQLTPRDRWILDRMSRAIGPASAREKFDRLRAFARAHKPLDIPGIFGQPPGTVFYAPFSFMPDRFGIYHSPAVDEGYFLGIVNMTTPLQIQRKLAEMTAQPQRPLLLLPDFEDLCTDHRAGDYDLLRGLFRYPYRAPVVHPENLASPLCATIRAQYHPAGGPTPANFDYVVWLPNSPLSRTQRLR